MIISSDYMKAYNALVEIEKSENVEDFCLTFSVTEEDPFAPVDFNTITRSSLGMDNYD